VTHDSTSKHSTADRRRDEHRQPSWDSASPCETEIQEIMTRPPLCLSPNTSIQEAREQLLDHGVRNAPVVDRSGRAIGMMALSHLTSFLESYSEMEELQDEIGDLVAISSGGIRYQLDDGFHLDRLVGVTVDDCMMSMVFELPTTALIAQAAALMSVEEVSQIIVTASDGTMCGWVSNQEIARWVAKTTGFWPRQRADAEHFETAEAIGELDPMVEHQALNLQSKSVMVIEDDAAICDGLIELLEEEGYTGIRALNGRQALDALKGEPDLPGLILLDLMMPEMNGWEFREAQLRDSELSDIPVVVLTAHSKRAASKIQEPAALLRKPVEADTLLATVAAHFSAQGARPTTGAPN